jgi:hypothetical protein
MDRDGGGNIGPGASSQIDNAAPTSSPGEQVQNWTELDFSQ